MTKIYPLTYITNEDPVPEQVLDVSKWFQTQTIELNFGSYSGRPAEGTVMLNNSMLSWFFGQGWYVDAVLGSSTGGNWKSTTTVRVDTNGSASGTSSSTHTTTVTDDSGDPWWWSYQKLRLKRRWMCGESILKDMVAEFTKAYNEGRRINDQRYDELVNLYALMLGHTEDELGVIPDAVSAYKSLSEGILDSMKSALKAYKNRLGPLATDSEAYLKLQVNRKFDSLEATAKQTMISNGTYNTTIWTTTLAGMERERAEALLAVAPQVIDINAKLLNIENDMDGKILDAAAKLMDAQTNGTLKVTDMRNTVFKWMLEFMERREDDYPGLDQLVQISEKLGYSQGGIQMPSA